MMSEEEKIVTGEVKGIKPETEISGETFDPVTVLNKVDTLLGKTKKLEERIKNIKNFAEKSEKVQEKNMNFIIAIIGIVAIAFTFAFIPLAFDYFRGNKEKFEVLNSKINEINTEVKILKELKTNEKQNSIFRR